MYVMGDVHGHPHVVRELLLRAGLTDARGQWRGGDARLWFIGDFVDRGPDSAGAVRLAMRLAREAARDGGHVGAVLGNHDALCLAAVTFGDRAVSFVPGGSFRAAWERSGGTGPRAVPDDRAVVWLRALPALARAGDTLLAHADAPLYEALGDSVAGVNAEVAAVLSDRDPQAWHALLAGFGAHHHFHDPAAVTGFLERFGGERVVHGHTPISKATGAPAAETRQPMAYAGERCLNVDGGVYLGGPGFLTWIHPRLGGRGPAAPWHGVAAVGSDRAIRAAAPGRSPS